MIERETRKLNFLERLDLAARKATVSNSLNVEIDFHSYASSEHIDLLIIQEKLRALALLVRDAESYDELGELMELAQETTGELQTP